jgi:hypothetical protein
LLLVAVVVVLQVAQAVVLVGFVQQLITQAAVVL